MLICKIYFFLGLYENIIIKGMKNWIKGKRPAFKYGQTADIFCAWGTVESLVYKNLTKHLG